MNPLLSKGCLLLRGQEARCHVLEPSETVEFSEHIVEQCNISTNTASAFVFIWSCRVPFRVLTCELTGALAYRSNCTPHTEVHFVSHNICKNDVAGNANSTSVLLQLVCSSLSLCAYLKELDLAEFRTVQGQPGQTPCPPKQAGYSYCSL